MLHEGKKIAMTEMEFFSRDFLLGFVGMLIATGWLTQLIKAIPFVHRLVQINKQLTGMICAVVAGFFCAICYQIAAQVLGDTPFRWATIPATSIVYATASSFAYEWFIKGKRIGRATA